MQRFTSTVNQLAVSELKGIIDSKQLDPLYISELIDMMDKQDLVEKKMKVIPSLK